MQSLGELDRGLAAAGLADDLAFGREHEPQRLAKDAMVVCEQHADRYVMIAHAGSGISARRTVPEGPDSDFELSTHQLEPLANPADTRGGVRVGPRRHPAAVVAHDHARAVIIAVDGDLDGARSGVARDVSQRLARDLPA